METIKDLKAFGISVVLVSLVCIGIILWKGTIAEASPPKPSKADIQNLEDIIQNQAKITQLKEWNKAEVSELNKNGWNVDWSSMQLVPFTE